MMQPGQYLDSQPESDISADQISIDLSDGTESHREESVTNGGPAVVNTAINSDTIKAKTTPEGV